MEEGRALMGPELRVVAPSFPRGVGVGVGVESVPHAGWECVGRWCMG